MKNRILLLGLLAAVILTWIFASESPERPIGSSPPKPLEPALEKGSVSLPIELESDDPLPPVVGDAFPLPAVSATRVKEVTSASNTAMSLDVGGDDFAARYDDLAARARSGDNAAAEELGTGLVACARFLKQQAEMEAIVAPNRKFASEAEREAAITRAETFVESEHSLLWQRKCSALSREQLAAANDWFEMAALRGDVAAAFAYTASAPFDQLVTDPVELIRYRETAARLMHHAASQCYPAAFNSLANSYAFGTYITPDAVRSMANRIVFGWLAGSATTVESASMALRASQAISGDPTELQLRQAQALAHRMYERYCQ